MEPQADGQVTRRQQGRDRGGGQAHAEPDEVPEGAAHPAELAPLVGLAEGGADRGGAEDHQADDQDVDLPDQVVLRRAAEPRPPRQDEELGLVDEEAAELEQVDRQRRGGQAAQGRHGGPPQAGPQPGELPPGEVGQVEEAADQGGAARGGHDHRERPAAADRHHQRAQREEGAQAGGEQADVGALVARQGLPGGAERQADHGHPERDGRAGRHEVPRLGGGLEQGAPGDPGQRHQAQHQQHAGDGAERQERRREGGPGRRPVVPAIGLRGGVEQARRQAEVEQRDPPGQRAEGGPEPVLLLAEVPDDQRDGDEPDQDRGGPADDARGGAEDDPPVPLVRATGLRRGVERLQPRDAARMADRLQELGEARCHRGAGGAYGASAGLSTNRRRGRPPRVLP